MRFKHPLPSPPIEGEGDWLTRGGKKKPLARGALSDWAGFRIQPDGACCEAGCASLHPSYGLNPRVPASKLSGHKDRFKIKLRSVGYRLVYEVRDGELVVVVVAIGKRERNAVYKAAAKR